MNKAYQELYKNLGLHIAFFRRKRGLTQLELSEMAGIDRSHMSAIELGKIGVSLDVIFRLCECLEITAKDLFDFR